MSNLPTPESVLLWFLQNVVGLPAFVVVVVGLIMWMMS
jgi:hypothetical protein